MILYFWCIENLGVVPLFLLLTFLTLPALLTAFLLFVLVLVVFELILNFLLLKLPKAQFLPTFKQLVKAISILLLTIMSGENGFCSNFEATTGEELLLVVGKGEQRELTPRKFQKFSVGNREVIDIKFLKEQGKLLIRGKSIGETDLILWNGKERRRMQIFVISKNEQLKLSTVIELLKNREITHELVGPMIILKGTIKTLETYLIIKNIRRNHLGKIISDLNLHHALKSSIIGAIYKEIYNRALGIVSCDSERDDIVCNYSSTASSITELTKNLEDAYFVKFIRSTPSFQSGNYLAKLKIIQMEKLDGSEISMGLNELNATVDDLFRKGVAPLVSQNSVLLKDENIELSTLAEPETILKVGEEATLSIGSNIPYQSKHKTEWFFAGLKMKLLLKESDEDLKLSYQVSLTRSVEENIYGNKESATCTVEINRPTQLFQIVYKSKGERTDGIPLLSKIPLIGSLFTYRADSENYIKIFAIISINEIKKDS